MCSPQNVKNKPEIQMKKNLNYKPRRTKICLWKVCSWPSFSSKIEPSLEETFMKIRDNEFKFLIQMHRRRNRIPTKFWWSFYFFVKCTFLLVKIKIYSIKLNIFFSIKKLIRVKLRNIIRISRFIIAFYFKKSIKFSQN